MDSERPVFVVGMARSGTTLIASMIGAHPELTIAPETHFLDLCVQARDYADSVLEQDRQSVWRDYSQGERFRILELDADAIAQRIESEDVRDFASMYRVLLQSYAKQHGRRGWGDKTHLEYQFVEWLLESYEDARIVCVIRDPRATVASLLKAPWSSGKAFYYALQWRETMGIVKGLNGSSRVLIVHYENAVTKTDETLAQICAFVGVTADEEMVNRTRDPSPVSENEDWSLGAWWTEHKAKALGPVTTESLDRWKQELTAYQVEVIEHLCGEEMRRWGYGRTTEGLTTGHAARLAWERGMRVMRALIRPWKAARRRRTISSPRV